MSYTSLVMDYEQNLRIVEVRISRRFAAGCLLWLFLVTTTPLAPVLTTGAGLADRSHHVALQQTARGIQVVLRHECPNSPTHRHGIVARALTLMAERPVGSQPDHIIQFTASAPLEQPPAFILAPAPDEIGPHLLIPCSAWRSLTWLPLPPAAYPRPPPLANSLPLQTRSTVLLV
jgi:hypothetical protein